MSFTAQLSKILTDFSRNISFLLKRVPVLVYGDTITSVVQIQYGHAFGSGFFVNFEEVVFFVTARHIVEGCASGDNIMFIEAKGNFSHRVHDIRHHLINDVSVIRFAEAVHTQTKRRVLPSLFSEVFDGESVVFLGFPSLPGYTLLYDNDPKKGHYKTATVSSHVKDRRNAPLILLDGLNNPGFSGGPVYVHGGGIGRVDGPQVAEAAICGVVSGYVRESPATGLVKKKDDAGTKIETDYFVELNSGIMFITPARVLLEILREIKDSAD